MAGDQKYWIDGQPLPIQDGDGSQTHWLDGLPVTLLSEPPPESWEPPGHQKPPKPEPPGPGNKPPRENQKDIREYRWRYLRNDTQGRYVAESGAFDVFDVPEVGQVVGGTFGETPSGILRGIQRGMMRMYR